MRSSALTRGIVALTACAAAAALLTAGTGAGAATAANPPYEPDANAIGTITFYDHTGNIITSGSTNVPFAGYALGSAATQSSDTHAGLAFANPNPSTKPYGWYTHVLGAFTSYPVPSPASLASQTGPVYTVGDDDLTLDEFEADSISYTGTGYTDMVQVRLYTTDASGTVDRNSYDDADLLVDTTSHTWTEVYPASGGTTTPTPDATSVSIAAPSSVKYGATVKITGTLQDTAKRKALPGQSVGLYERANSKTSARLVTTVKSASNGALSASVKVTAGEQFQWRYSATSAYKASSSAYKSIAAATSVSLSVDHSTLKHGATATFYGSTTPATSGIRVELQQLVGRTWKNVASGVQKRQKLPNKKTAVAFRISHKFAKKGTYTFRVSKAATSSLSGSVSRTITEHVK